MLPYQNQDYDFCHGSNVGTGFHNRLLQLLDVGLTVTVTVTVTITVTVTVTVAVTVTVTVTVVAKINSP